MFTSQTFYLVFGHLKEINDGCLRTYLGEKKLT